MPVVKGSPFRINWRKLEDVKVYARKLGPGHVVIKVPGRGNYNITFAERYDRYKPEWVVHKT